MAVVVLIVAFLVIPLVELWAILEVGARIGILPTLVILLAISILGGWTVKRVGLGVWRRARVTLDRGEIPGKEMLDGTIVLGAGALLLVPGFVTDLIGFLILIPFVRAAIRLLVTRRYIGNGRVQVKTVHVESEWSGPSDIVEGELAQPPRELEP